MVTADNKRSASLTIWPTVLSGHCGRDEFRCIAKASEFSAFTAVLAGCVLDGRDHLQHIRLVHLDYLDSIVFNLVLAVETNPRRRTTCA